jgi:hypothetical protein
VNRRRLARAARVTLAVALGVTGAAELVVLGALAWWSREAPENPYESLDALDQGGVG